MTNLDAIKARLKGLLAIAKDDAASENEIQSALRIAARMMESHHLSEEDLQESEQDQFAEARNAERGRANAYVGRKVCAWEGFLAAFVRDFVGGIGVYKDHTVGRTPAGLVMNGGEPLGTITFYGILEDCQLATEVYNELRIVITAMASLRYGRVQKGDGAAYSEGFVAGLQANRKTDAAKLLTHNTSTGMILAKRRNELVRLKTDLATDWLKNETKIKLSAGRRGGTAITLNEFIERLEEYPFSYPFGSRLMSKRLPKYRLHKASGTDILPDRRAEVKVLPSRVDVIGRSVYSQLLHAHTWSCS